MKTQVRGSPSAVFLLRKAISKYAPNLNLRRSVTNPLRYYGHFQGDIKDWLLKMVDQGLFSTSTYVNVGNAGMEPFYGTVSFENTVGLQINL